MKKQADLLTIGSIDALGQAGIVADRSGLMGLGFMPAIVVSGINLGPGDFAPLDNETFDRQLKALGKLDNVQGIKTGILAKRETIETLSTFLEDDKEHLPNLVVDSWVDMDTDTPILSSTALSLLKMRLLPLATLTIVYLSEAERLAGVVVDTIDRMKEAAEAVRLYGSKFVLIRADKLIEDELVDILYDGSEHQFLFSKSRPEGDLRQTRDMFASGVIAYLAKNYRLKLAVETAKDFALAPRVLGQEKPA